MFGTEAIIPVEKNGSARYLYFTVKANARAIKFVNVFGRILKNLVGVGRVSEKLLQTCGSFPAVARSLDRLEPETIWYL